MVSFNVKLKWQIKNPAETSNLCLKFQKLQTFVSHLLHKGYNSIGIEIIICIKIAIVETEIFKH